jgi:hypothetical protein
VLRESVTSLSRSLNPSWPGTETLHLATLFAEVPLSQQLEVCIISIHRFFLARGRKDKKLIDLAVA